MAPRAEARVDDDISDEVAGRARQELAAASKAKKAADASAIAAKNAEMRERLAQQGAKTDANLEDADDAAANERRKELAAGSAARRADDAARLGAENAALAQRRSGTGPRTDDDIMDEAAGRARLELAAASKARRADDAAALAEANSALASRRSQVEQRTDDDIMDEEAGKMRLKLAAQYKAKREKQAAELAAKNAELQRRLALVRSRTNDGKGGGGPTGDLTDDLPPLERASTLSYATYLRFQANEENRVHADEVRAVKAQMGSLREAQALEWIKHGRQRVRERRQRQKQTRKAMGQLHKTNQEKVAGIRAEEAAWEELRIERKKDHEREGRVRVLEAAALDARLDAQEEAQDAREREEFSHQRAQIAEAAAEVRRSALLDKQRLASAQAAARVGVLVARSARLDLTSHLGEVKRDEAKHWEVQRQQREDEYLQRARDNRARAHAWRVSAKRSLRSAWKAKVKNAVKERGNDHLVAEEKLRIRQANRKEVQAVYGQRFASSSMEGLYLASPNARLSSARSSSRSVSRADSHRSHSSADASPRAPPLPIKPLASTASAVPPSPLASPTSSATGSPATSATPSSPLPLTTSVAKAKAARESAVNC